MYIAPTRPQQPSMMMAMSQPTQPLPSVIFFFCCFILLTSIVYSSFSNDSNVSPTNTTTLHNDHRGKVWDVMTGREEASNDDKGPKRCQTRRLGLGESFFLYTFFLSLILVNALFMYLGSILWNVQQGGRRRPEMMRCGPNDARRTVWAYMKKFFFLLFLWFLY